MGSGSANDATFTDQEHVSALFEERCRFQSSPVRRSERFTHVEATNGFLSPGLRKQSLLSREAERFGFESRVGAEWRNRIKEASVGGKKWPLVHPLSRSGT